MYGSSRITYFVLVLFVAVACIFLGRFEDDTSSKRKIEQKENGKRSRSRS